MAAADDLLTLQEAADRLKVHYMTAYRWVRKGELTAFKAGGRLRVRTEDLEAFVRSRQVDVALPGARPGRTDWDTHRTRLLELLLDGRGVDAGGLVRKVVADGAAAGEVYVELLAPVLHQVGDAWSAGELTVAEEHRATEICLAIMARLAEYFRRRGPSRGTAVTMTPPGDQHALGSAMVADFMRAAGYDVHHLGANVPVEDLRLFLQVVPTDALCVSVTNPGIDLAVLRDLAGAAEDAGALLVLGGQGVGPARAAEVGAIYVEGLAELAETLEARARASTA